jgi:3'-5' exoribonuclease
MPRRFVSELCDRENVDEVYLAGRKSLRPNRNGDLFLQVELTDRTGMLPGLLWNATEAIFRSFEDGDYIRVGGRAQLYQGSMQILATSIHKVPANEIEAEDFIPRSAISVERLSRRLRDLLRGMKSVPLRNLAECFLMDDVFLQKFCRAPAGIKNHHAYAGGLLEHVVTIMEIVARIADLYPAMDSDLLLMGVFLHDAGKIDELSYDGPFGYTDEGQLIGHLVMAVTLLDTKLKEAEKLAGEPFPTELALKLKHLVVSHHGEYEFGSPKLPMTLEAVALTQLDNLDARLNSFLQQMRDDPNVDSPWTMYNPQIGRKLYKGSGPLR